MWVAVANPSLASPNSPDPALHPVPSRGDPTRPGFSAVCRGCGVSQRLAGSDSPPPQCRSLRRVIGDTSSVSGPDRQPPHSGAGRPLPETRPQNRTLPPAHEPLGPAFSSAVNSAGIRCLCVENLRGYHSDYNDISPADSCKCRHLTVQSSPSKIFGLLYARPTIGGDPMV